MPGPGIQYEQNRHSLHPTGGERVKQALPSSIVFQKVGKGEVGLWACVSGSPDTRQESHIDIRTVGLGVETGLWEPKEKAWVSTGGIQAGFTQEMAFDLDTEQRRHGGKKL